MLISRFSRIFFHHSDAEQSAPSGAPTPDQPLPAQPEKKPVEEETRPSTLGENWPPNLHSHEAEVFVMPETEPQADADRPMM
jgi:hypothetical protein